MTNYQILKRLQKIEADINEMRNKITHIENFLENLTSENECAEPNNEDGQEVNPEGHCCAEQNNENVQEEVTNV
jgi:hypothetical protein